MLKDVILIFVMCLFTLVGMADDSEKPASLIDGENSQDETPRELARWWQGQLAQPEVYWRTFAFKKEAWSATAGVSVVPAEDDWVDLNGVKDETTIQWDLQLGYPYSRALRVEFETDPDACDKSNAPQFSDFRVSVKRVGKDEDFTPVPIAMVVASVATKRVVATIDGDNKTSWPIDGPKPQVAFEFARPIRCPDSCVVIRIESTLQQPPEAAKVTRMRISSTFHIDPHRQEPLPADLRAIIFRSGPNAASKDQLDRVQDFFETHIAPKARFKKWKENLKSSSAD